MTVVRRCRVYTVYDFEDDIIVVAKTEKEANKIAKYYNGYVVKEYLVKKEKKVLKKYLTTKETDDIIKLQ